MYFVYIVKCADKTLYTGICVDLKRRIKEHNTSNLGAKYTRSRRPVKLVYGYKYRNRSTSSKAKIVMKKLNSLKEIYLIQNPKSALSGFFGDLNIICKK